MRGASRPMTIFVSVWLAPCFKPGSAISASHRTCFPIDGAQAYCAARHNGFAKPRVTKSGCGVWPPTAINRNIVVPEQIGLINPRSYHVLDRALDIRQSTGGTPKIRRRALPPIHAIPLIHAPEMNRSKLGRGMPVMVRKIASLPATSAWQ
jgi:hypothetical protein